MLRKIVRSLNESAQTLAGVLNLSIPQTRNSDFYPECLERGMRSGRALRIAMAEMYIHGVATRKVRDILETLVERELYGVRTVGKYKKQCVIRSSKKRTRCIKVFPDKESLIRIATALLIEPGESWLAEDKVYIGC